MTDCPVCRGAEIEPLLTRRAMPVHQNLVLPDRAQARSCTRGDIRLMGCTACGFVWNAAFDPARLSYGAAYDHTQRHSSAYGAHFRRRLARARTWLKGARSVVEIGCGRGEFLKGLVAALPDAQGIGVDPSHRGPKSALGGRVTYVEKLYRAEVPQPAEAVVLRHVLAHLPDPVTLMASLRSPGTRLLIETPDLASTLAQGSFFDVFYEYCSYFSRPSLAVALSRAGFGAAAMRTVYDQQYLWVEATAGPPQPEPGRAAAQSILERTRHMASLEAREIRKWRQLFAARPGETALWGAAAKGTTLANLADPEGTLIPALIDNNPAKQGGFVGGSGHPILSPAQAVAHGVKRAVATNPLYVGEIRRQVANQGLALEILSPV